MAPAEAETGLFASLRRMLATLIALAQTRLELVGVEIEEQIAHAASVLFWSIAAMFFLSMSVLLLALMVVIAFWDVHRLLAAGLVTATFALAALLAALVARHRLRTRPRLLATLASEFERDAAALEGDAP
ncbi:MAG TPA: phage holin family protein [Steroidobacteraceae bacterium]|nr:phage holin family protein [Steroidobacteraceae bacterium]